MENRIRIIVFILIMLAFFLTLYGDTLDRVETRINNDIFTTDLFIDGIYSGTYGSFTLKSDQEDMKTRIVYDFSNLKLRRGYRYDESFNRFITRIRVGQYREDTLRLVFSSNLPETELSYTIAVSKDRITVTVTRIKVPEILTESVDEIEINISDDPYTPPITGSGEGNLHHDAANANANGTDIDTGKDTSPHGALSVMEQSTESDSDKHRQSAMISKHSERREYNNKDRQAHSEEKTHNLSRSYILHRFLFPLSIIIILYELFSFSFSFSLNPLKKYIFTKKPRFLRFDEKDYFSRARADYFIFLIKFGILCILLLYCMFIYANFNNIYYV